MDDLEPRPAGLRGARAVRMLDESEERFRLLVESVRDYAIFMLDPLGYIATWNAGAERIKGYRPEEILGRHFSVFYPPEDLAWNKPAWALQVATAEGRFEDEGWRLRKDGTRFWANVIITALRDRNGELRGFGKVTRDLTERRRAEEEIRRLNADLELRVAERTAELERTIRQRDEFLSVAAHELKTPITTLRLSAQQLLRLAGRAGGIDPERLHRTLAHIDQQSEKLARLVAQLLDISRLEAGRLILEPAPADLTELVKESVRAARVGTDRHLIRVRAPGPVAAVVDRLRIEQVLANLLGNAIKFSPDGGDIEVEVGRPAPDRVRVAVRDHGIGVPPEHRAAIFERFYQVDPGTHLGGMGLGLYVSREIIELHGGELRAEFPEDGGARLVLTLPAGPTGPATPRG